MTNDLTSVVQSLKHRFHDEILRDSQNHNQTLLTVSPKILRQVTSVLKTEFGFSQLLDVVAVDWHPKTEARFELDYLFYNIANKTRLTLQVFLDDSPKVTIDSIADLHPAADWAERECYDMMGIDFANHPNLKRLLMWENFIGHPLRKDYPLNRRQPIPVQEDIV